MVRFDIDLCRICIYVNRHIVAFHLRLNVHMTQNLHRKQPGFKLPILLAHEGAALPRHGKGLFRLSVLLQAEPAVRRRKVLNRCEPALRMPCRHHCRKENQALSYTGSHSTQYSISLPSHVAHARASFLSI